MTRLLRIGLMVVSCLTLASSTAAAQQITGEQIRRQIQQSGLTPDQIRERLAAAGYSRAMLDSYLGNRGPAPEPSTDILRALQSLSVGQLPTAGLELVPVDTGRVPMYLDTLALLADSTLDSTAVDTVLQVFGLEVFRATTSQFQPLLAGPVPDTYKVGAGDLLVLVVSGDVELVHNLEVTRDGFILIPQVGQLYVNGLEMSQLRQALRQRLGQSYSGIRSGSTRFDVTLARLRTNQVFVVGEVAQPGAYNLASVATVLNALYAAGGPTERANLRSVRVQRQGETVTTVDLYDYLLRGDVRSDVTLEMGDVVFVGVHGTRVSLHGAVVRPAIYELGQGQTLRELVAFAGGFRPDASLRRISISRIVPPAQRGPTGPDRIVVDVPVDQVADGEAPAFPLEPGDEIRVFEVPDARRGTVAVAGAVYLPGEYGWRPGLRLSDVIRYAGGLRPAVYADIAHISRLNVADSTRYLIRVSLPADTTSPYPDDVLLADYDEVTVFGREEFRSNRTVRVSGYVNEPGEYPFVEGMTIRDLLLQARGLRDGAYLDSVEVARLPADRSAGQMARILRVSLDSSYLFEPEGSSYRFLPGPPSVGRRPSDVPLEPYDRVSIFPQPQFEFQRTVVVAGEVQLPGPYALQRKDERLSSLVRRSGGLLPSAYALGARLIRPQNGAGRVDIDLAAALAQPGGREDLVLQPGDSLEVPEYNPVVRVQGAVNSPSSVQYRPGESLSYYISNAGGWARDADKWSVSVRRANGSASTTERFLFFKNDPDVGPGSVITVQSKAESEPFNVTAFLSATAQILASTVAIIVVATR